MIYSISFHILEPCTNSILQHVSFHNLFFIYHYHFEIYSFQIYRCGHLFHCLLFSIIRRFYNFFMDSTVDWYLGCFQFVTITRNSAINICVYVSLFMFARILLQVDLTSWKVCAFLSSPEIKRLSSKVVAIYMPNTVYKNIWTSTYLPNLGLSGVNRILITVIWRFSHIETGFQMQFSKWKHVEDWKKNTNL